MTWAQGVKGLLLDVTGVLYNSGPNGGTPIPGSKEAIDKLRSAGVPYKLCSNESVCTREAFANKLRKHGFVVDADDIICPAPAMAKILMKEGLRPYLLVHTDVLPEFSALDTSNPNCVVVGDCMEQFLYESLNQAFRVLLAQDKKILYSLGAGYYYKQGDELVLDVGAYATMLEKACGCTKIVCGKPEPGFFTQALEELGVTAAECAMVGDDIIHDVGGAQKMGMKGLQVRTGKYRSCDEPHDTIKPDAYVDNLADAVDQLLAALK